MFNRNKTAPTLNSSCSSFYLLPTSTQIAVNLVCSIPYCSGMSFSGCFSFEYSFLLLLESVSPFCIWEQWWRRLAWGQSSQPLHSPARNLGQRKWGLWCLPQRVVGGGWELNQKTGHKEHNARFWLVERGTRKSDQECELWLPWFQSQLCYSLAASLSPSVKRGHW